MSKSATEQFQIKKKRKLNNNSNNNNNSHHYTNNNNNNNNNNNKNNTTTTKRRYVNGLSAHYLHLNGSKQIVLQSLPHNKKFYKFPKEASPVIIAATLDACRLRDQLQVVAAMPLSQGFYAKGPLAGKRGSGNGGGSCGIKAVKVCGRDESKRKSSENYGRYSSSNNTSSNNNNNISNYNTSNYNTSVYFPTTAQRKLNAAHNFQVQQMELLQGAHSSNLQLSYLLGESLARYGRVQEAFDIYAIIASEQHDGHIPLDRLGTLASSLIVYVRQLSNSINSNSNNSSSSSMDTLDVFDAAMKTKYTKHASTASNWHAAGATAASFVTAPSVTNTVLGDGSNSNFQLLHTTTRVPSPANCSDTDAYDPLLCPLCRDILRCPVTTNCGHTFCRQCCETITQCNICNVKFPKMIFDDFVSATTRQFMAAASTTTTTTTTTTTITSTPNAAAATFYNGNGSSSNNNNNNNNNTPPTITNHRFNNFAPSSPLNLRLVVGASPTTVTTTTVASTTATATTTMASTSSAAAVAAGTVNNMKFMPDVLVRRLVEKWWGADLQAKKINETAASYMHLNLLDDALKFCNASLEKSPQNFKSLLLRAEVLRKLNHFQSSLADVENAVKTRYTSAKAHYLRALAQSELGRIEEALYSYCLAICLDKSTNLTSSELFQHDLVKILQKLLAQTPSVAKGKYGNSHRNFALTAPYSVLAEHRLRRKQIALLCKLNGDHFSAYEQDVDDDFIVACDQQCDIMADDEDYIVNCTPLSQSDAAAYASVSNAHELSLRRHTSRKHFRRKWMTKEKELLPTLDDARCSALFRNILDRTLQEVQRLQKVEVANAKDALVSVPTSLIDASDFDCVLCCRTFWKPVVTPCGHTYCWVCLDRCMDYTSLCPLCMSPLVEPNVNVYQGSSSPVPFTLAKRPVTKFLEAAMKRFIPDSYEKRFRQEMDMEPSVPMFICTTAFPYVPCPLFVYEPRYRLMVRRAIESGEKQFGIVQSHGGKSRYFDYGTILDIRDCMLLGDGCSILSTIGCKRFKILARNEKDGYETAKIEYIYDEIIADGNVKFLGTMHAAVLAKAIDWFESVSTEKKREIQQSYGEMPPLEENWETIADGPAWAWWIIALLPLNQQLKVEILATTSLEKRLRAIEKTLDCLSGTFRRTQEEEEEEEEDCSVVVVQQHQQQHHHHHQQQQQQHQQQQHPCDNELAQTCQTDECCQCTTGVMHNSAEAHTTTASEQQAQLML